jgi:hypothetical protein
MPTGGRTLVAAGALVVSGMVLAACGSHARATSASTSTTSSGATTAPTVATGAPSGNATVSMSCPSVAVVNAALGQADTGPVVSGTPQYKVCTYQGPALSTTVTVSVGTPLEFGAAEQNVTSHGLTVVTVPDLGAEAWATRGSGVLAVLKGTTQVQITSPLSSTAQLETLARQIL